MIKQGKPSLYSETVTEDLFFSTKQQAGYPSSWGNGISES